MNSKRKNIFLYIFMILLLLIISIPFLRNSGILNYHVILHDYCRPSVKSGNFVVTSSLKKPSRFDLISFYTPPMGFIDDKKIDLLRLIGLPGDTIEIRNGDLYVNHQFSDDQLDILQEYGIHQQRANTALRLLKYDSARLRLYTLWDTVYFQLSRQDIKLLTSKKIPFKRHIKNRQDNFYRLDQRFHWQWNPDHFGPYIVPADSSFLLGDNRNGCRDSRDFGPIAVNRWVGTVLNH